MIFKTKHPHMCPHNHKFLRRAAIMVNFKDVIETSAHMSLDAKIKATQVIILTHDWVISTISMIFAHPVQHGPSQSGNPFGN